MDGKATQQKPKLIFDGDCTFCLYWIAYWKKLTGDAVVYQPYQAVAKEHPTISHTEFQQAVQYIAPNGTVSRAAKASFLTLSHAPGKNFWLWLYEKIPGFALITEIFYKVIASHRSFAYYCSLLFWGKNYEPPRFDLIAWLFTRGIGILFLIAFISFHSQALGLIGSHGLVPIEDLTDALQLHLGSSSYWLLPMVFWLNTSDIMIQLICWAGIIFSCTLILNIFPRISLLLIYLFYLSLINAGQAFMAFQWDLFLLEAGVIAIFFVGGTHLGAWLLRWLLFRFVLAGGLVKVFSGEPAWRDFSTLSYHFFTQPLPTPLAWYANQLPISFLQFGTIATLVIELLIPFFIFFPRHIRFFSAFAILFLQTMILLTGNYNFFNLETMLLCLVLFDDAAIKKILPQRFINWLSQPKLVTPIMPYVGYLFAALTVTTSLTQFDLRFSGSAPELLTRLNNNLAPLRIVNLYGPFAVITKERMEIILEGSDDGTNWKEYAFKYKPGNIYQEPTWNFPHQPRLDWQMWFAALGTPEENPWFTRLLVRLLENSPPVIALLENNPFPKRPPRYVRAEFYEYRFTDNHEKDQTGAYWNRRLVRSYFPEAHL